MLEGDFGQSVPPKVFVRLAATSRTAGCRFSSTSLAPNKRNARMNANRQTLFVVDEDPDTRTNLAEMATSMGWDCQPFTCAEEFLERFDPALSGCVVTDLRLRGMDGLGLQERLASLSKAPPVIFFTTHGSIPVVVQAMRKGALAVLEKPCAAEELASVLRLAGDINPSLPPARPTRADLRSRFTSLTLREREAMAGIVAGAPNKAIARQLGVSQRTANRIRATVFKKMAVKSAVDLARVVGDSQEERLAAG